MISIQEAPGPMAKCQYCGQTVFGSESWHERCRIQGLERELAAAQAKLDDLRAALDAAGTVTGNMMREYAEMRNKLATIEPLLKRIERGPIMPLPDPVAHSWEAFGKRAHCALCDSMCLANEAIRALKKEQRK